MHDRGRPNLPALYCWKYYINNIRYIRTSMPCAGQALLSTGSAQGMALFRFHTVVCSAKMCLQIYIEIMIYVRLTQDCIV